MSSCSPSLTYTPPGLHSPLKRRIRPSRCREYAAWITFTWGGSPSQKRWSRAGRGDTSCPEGWSRQNQGPVGEGGVGMGHEMAKGLVPQSVWLRHSAVSPYHTWVERCIWKSRMQWL